MKQIAVISTETSDSDAPLVVPVLTGSRLDDLPVRVSRTPCLDGSQYIDRRGFFPADREILIKTRLTPVENARLVRMIEASERLTLATREGLFSGVISSVTGAGGMRTIRFLPADFTEPPVAVPVERVSPTDYSSGGVWRGDGTQLAAWSFGYWQIERLAGYSRKNFLYFSSVALPAGATSLTAVFTSTNDYHSDYYVDQHADVSLCLESVAMPAVNDPVADLEALTWSTPVMWHLEAITTGWDYQLTMPDLGDHIAALLAAGYDGAGILIKIDGTPYYATDSVSNRKLQTFSGASPPVLTVA